MTITPSGSTESRKQASTSAVRIFIRPQVRRKTPWKVCATGCRSGPFLAPGAAGARRARILAAVGVGNRGVASAPRLLECLHEALGLVEQMIEFLYRPRGIAAQVIHVLAILAGAKRRLLDSNLEPNIAPDLLREESLDVGNALDVIAEHDHVVACQQRALG